MHTLKGLVTAVACLSLMTGAPTLFAQDHEVPSDNNHSQRAFGLGQPSRVGDLPPGQFKRSLKALPKAARGKALGTLKSFTFSEADLEHLRVDGEGGVYYADTYLPEPVEGDDALDIPMVEQISAGETFLLHSRPGSANVLYLDFDGHTISGTAWNSGRPDPLYAPSYDPSLDDSIATACNRGSGTAPVQQVNFSSTELARIGEIWHRVAEDFAAWDIDVTTEEPASFGPTVGRLLFTDDVDLCGDDMPSKGAGGVAYVVVFGNSNYHTYTSPALVYWTNLSGGAATTNHEAGSHEFGHNLGLAHDGTSSTSYYLGHGSSDSSPVDLTSWAPIMGAGYYRNVTQWSKGDYPDAVKSGSYQSNADDIAVITSELGYRPDDHGDTRATATALNVAGDGSILVTTPEDDPHGFDTTNQGVIETRDDLDYFWFDTGAGAIDLVVEPGWAAFYRATTRRGANLDVAVSLYDATGALVASDDPTNDTGARLTLSVAAGRYYLAVDGVGNAGNSLDPNNIHHGYDDYSSIGQFFVSGTVQPSSSDQDPPSPNPLNWSVEPWAVDGSRIRMTVATASDASGVVEYRFDCVSGGAGCGSSGWVSGTTWTAAGLTAGVSYTFEAVARDAYNNVTGATPQRSATPPVLPPDASPNGLAATGMSTSRIDVSWNDNASNETGYRLEVSTDGANFSTLANLPANANAYSHTGLPAGVTRHYRAVAVNSAGERTSNTDDGTTHVPPPQVDYLSIADTTASGTVSGAHGNTHVDDGATQSIREVQSGGKKRDRHSLLQHTWQFNITGGDEIALHANAWRSSSSDGDNFEFSWSPDGSNFTPLFTVSSLSSANDQLAYLPNTLDGNVWIRVEDTNRSGGASELNTVFVDHLFLRVSNAGPPSLPAAPSNLVATADGPDAISLTWTDNANNESGFHVQRSQSPDSGWVTVATPGSTADALGDNNLTANTTYYYRVRAWNSMGNSAWSNVASATTLNTPPPAAIELSTTGSKVRGKKQFTYSWSGAVGAQVDVYRDGNKVATTANDGHYVENSSLKGGGSHTHRVCEANTNNCSDTTSTTF